MGDVANILYYYWWLLIIFVHPWSILKWLPSEDWVRFGVNLIKVGTIRQSPIIYLHSDLHKEQKPLFSYSFNKYLLSGILCQALGRSEQVYFTILLEDIIIREKLGKGFMGFLCIILMSACGSLLSKNNNKK